MAAEICEVIALLRHFVAASRFGHTKITIVVRAGDPAPICELILTRRTGFEAAVDHEICLGLGETDKQHPFQSRSPRQRAHVSGKINCFHGWLCDLTVSTISTQTAEWQQRFSFSFSQFIAG